MFSPFENIIVCKFKYSNFVGNPNALNRAYFQNCIPIVPSRNFKQVFLCISQLSIPLGSSLCVCKKKTEILTKSSNYLDYQAASSRVQFTEKHERKVYVCSMYLQIVSQDIQLKSQHHTYIGITNQTDALPTFLQAKCLMLCNIFEWLYIV